MVSNQPLAAALDALLGPLDLTWRIIDGQTLQVVTPERLAEQGEFEFYKVGELINKDLSGEARWRRFGRHLATRRFAMVAAVARFALKVTADVCWRGCRSRSSGSWRRCWRNGVVRL